MLCSTGDATPLGTIRLEQHTAALLMYNGTYCQYLSLITGDYLIHSITYERYGDIYSLQTIGYNMLGVNKSADVCACAVGSFLGLQSCKSGRLRQVTIITAQLRDLSTNHMLHRFVRSDMGPDRPALQ